MSKKYVIEYEEAVDFGEPIKMVVKYEVEPPESGTDVIKHFIKTHDMEKVVSFCMRGKGSE